MGKVIFGFDFLDYAPSVSVGAANAAYPVTQLANYKSRTQHCESQAATDFAVVFDFGAAKEVKGVVLVDVNFASCYLEGNSSNAWGAPAWRNPSPAGNIAIVQDIVTRRRSIFIDLRQDTFNYQFLRVFVPGQATTDGAGHFRWSTAVFLLSSGILEMSEWPDLGYLYDAPKRYSRKGYTTGGSESCELSDQIGSVEMKWGRFDKSSEADLWTLNDVGQAVPMIFYENLGNTSRVLCGEIASDLKPALIQPAYLSTATVRFEEYA